MQEENPFSGNVPAGRRQGPMPGPAHGPGSAGDGVTIPFEPGDRKLFGRVGLWMTLAGVGNAAVGLGTLAMVVLVEFAWFGVFRGLLWVAVGVLTLLAGLSAKEMEKPSPRDLPLLDDLFTKIRILFAVKAGAAGFAILLALTIWRFAIRYGMPT